MPARTTKRPRFEMDYPFSISLLPPFQGTVAPSEPASENAAHQGDVSPDVPVSGPPVPLVHFSDDEFAASWELPSDDLEDLATTGSGGYNSAVEQLNGMKPVQWSEDGLSLDYPGVQEQHERVCPAAVQDLVGACQGILGCARTADDARVIKAKLKTILMHIPDHPSTTSNRATFASRVLSWVPRTTVAVCTVETPIFSAALCPIKQVMSVAMEQCAFVQRHDHLKCLLGDSLPLVEEDQILFDIYIDTGCWNGHSQVGVGLKLLNVLHGPQMFPLAVIPYAAASNEPKCEKEERWREIMKVLRVVMAGVLDLNGGIHCSFRMRWTGFSADTQWHHLLFGRVLTFDLSCIQATHELRVADILVADEQSAGGSPEENEDESSDSSGGRDGRRPRVWQVSPAAHALRDAFGTSAPLGTLCKGDPLHVLRGVAGYLLNAMARLAVKARRTPHLLGKVRTAIAAINGHASPSARVAGMSGADFAPWLSGGGPVFSKVLAVLQVLPMVLIGVQWAPSQAQELQIENVFVHALVAFNHVCTYCFHVLNVNQDPKLNHEANAWVKCLVSAIMKLNDMGAGINTNTIKFKLLTQEMFKLGRPAPSAGNCQHGELMMRMLASHQYGIGTRLGHVRRGPAVLAIAVRQVARESSRVRVYTEVDHVAASTYHHMYSHVLHVPVKGVPRPVNISNQTSLTLGHNFTVRDGSWIIRIVQAPTDAAMELTIELGRVCGIFERESAWYVNYHVASAATLEGSHSTWAEYCVPPGVHTYHIDGSDKTLAEKVRMRRAHPCLSWALPICLEQETYECPADQIATLARVVRIGEGFWWVMADERMEAAHAYMVE